MATFKLDCSARVEIVVEAKNREEAFDRFDEVLDQAERDRPLDITTDPRPEDITCIKEDDNEAAK